MLLERMSWRPSNKEGDTRLCCLRKRISAVSTGLRNVLTHMRNDPSFVTKEV